MQTLEIILVSQACEHTGPTSQTVKYFFCETRISWKNILPSSILAHMANMSLGQTWLQSCGSFKFSLPSAPGTLAQEHLAQFKLAPWSHHPSPPTLVLRTPDRRTKIRAPCFFLQWKATKGQASWISTSSGVYPTFSLQTKDRFVRPHQLPPSACWILPQGASWGNLPDLLETGWTHTTRPLTREGMETISHSWLNSNHIHYIYIYIYIYSLTYMWSKMNCVYVAALFWLNLGEVKTSPGSKWLRLQDLASNLDTLDINWYPRGI